MLEDSYFDCCPRRVLHGTCGTCLVSYSNDFIPFPKTTIHHSNNIYIRRDTIPEVVIEELQVLIYPLWRLNLKGTMIKVCLS